METPGSGQTRLTELDGVRFVAITRVMVWHATGWAWTTWIVSAVPAMFGVTGALMARTARKNGSIQMATRRLTRFFPAWLVYAGFVVIISRQSMSARSPIIDFLVPFRIPSSDVAGKWFTSALWYLSSYLWVVILSPFLLRTATRWGYVPAALLASCTVALSWSGLDTASSWWRTTDIVLYSACTSAGMAWESRGASRKSLVTVLIVSVLSAAVWARLRWPVDSVVNNDHALHLMVGAAWASLFLLLPSMLRAIARQRPARLVNRASLTVYLWHSAVAWTAWRFLPSNLNGAVRPLAAATITLLSPALLVPLLSWVENFSFARMREPGVVARGVVLLSVTATLAMPSVQRRVDFHASAVDQPLPPSAAPVIVDVQIDQMVSDMTKSLRVGTDLPIEAMQRVLETHNDRMKLGGLRAVVVSADGRRWAGLAGGMAGFERKSLVGSITKTFTTSLVMSEVESGRISLDNRVGTLGIGFGHPELTVRQLLTHSSGIVKVTENRSLLEDGTTPQQVVTWAGRKPLNFVPGTRVEYSTTGFAVLGLYLEQVTHKSFEDLVRERIASPYGYDIEFFRGRYHSIGFATGGIIMGMEDLADWMRRYVSERSVPGGAWAWDFRGTTGIGIHGYCPCEGKSFTALGHMGGRTFTTVDADGTVIVVDSDGILVNSNYRDTQSLAQELRLLAGGGKSMTRP